MKDSLLDMIKERSKEKVNALLDKMVSAENLYTLEQTRLVAIYTAELLRSIGTFNTQIYLQYIWEIDCKYKETKRRITSE